MKKKGIHVSPDMFDPNKTNVFDPDTDEFLGQIEETEAGIKTSSFRDSSTRSINDLSDGYSFLRTAIRARAPRFKKTPWNDRQDQVRRNVLRY